MVPTMLPAVVSGLNGLAPLNVATAVNEGGAAPDPDAAVCTPSGFRQTKVHQLRTARRQHDVPRLQIAMHNSIAMSHPQRFRDVNPNPENFGQRQSTITESLGESFPFQKLHHQKIGAVVRADIVKLADVRMI